jgi:hypothetical protein
LRIEIIDFAIDKIDLVSIILLEIEKKKLIFLRCF